MAVRIRLKKMGRRHRSYFRVCAMDQRSPRDGRVLEELGTYDPMVTDVDARAVLNGERISYWLGVGAQPSDKVKVLIKKYGAEGSHLEKQKAALEQIAQPRVIPDPGTPASLPKKEEEAAEAPAAEAPDAQAATEAPAAQEEPVEAIIVDEAPAVEAAAEAPAKEAPAEEDTKSTEEPSSE